jgi:hemoglobin/transferrin/lactoferrin receptor protein
MRYSTINQEQSIALNLNYASKNFALTLVSFNDFGDLKWEKIKSQGRFF